MKPLLIAIVGPTASGKSSMAVSLARTFHGEIVCADSRQIYRGMDIGTAKIPPAEMHGVPHHLLDIRDVSESYSVAEYQHDAFTAIDDILDRHTLPFLVGGTGQYISAVVQHWNIPAIPPNIRQRLDVQHRSTEDLFQELQSRFPRSASSMDSHNRHRILRALERDSNVLPTPLRLPPKYRVLLLGIDLPRTELYARINDRVELMMQSGFLDEVRALRNQYSCHAPAMNAIGYRELCAHLEDDTSLPETISAIQQATRRYAKRQLTWFRHMNDIHWITTDKEASALIAAAVDHS